MNQVTHEEKKDSLTKTLAIIGFVAAVLFALWLAVQLVSIIPSAFHSLASIADGVYNNKQDQELVVASKNSVVNTGEAFTLSWTELARPGSYTFSYECTDGASVEVRTSQGNIIDLDCDTPFILGDKTSLDVIVDSEKQRFVDIPYTVTHTPKNSNLDVTKTDSKITIVNASIPTRSVAVNEEEEVVTTPDVVEETPVQPAQIASTPAKPEVVAAPIYAIPVSDPHGKVDLAVTYRGAGILIGKTFKKAGSIATDQKGAFQFEVKNIGTKTAKDWSYTAQLPSGITYESGPQVALKPNEKAIITLGFEGLSKTGIERFGAEVEAKGDINTKNNSFTWAIEVVE